MIWFLLETGEQWVVPLDRVVIITKKKGAKVWEVSLRNMTDTLKVKTYSIETGGEE